tara:strand:+ start:184 stop:426 length:243 start_codon:yes stop_codon:yes gene_type:complete
MKEGKYFDKIEAELNSVIERLANNMVDAINNNEWEAVLLSAGAIMDNVKTIHPTAAGNLHRIMNGKFNGDRPMDNAQLFG